jgi:dTDP-4-amino-4,6-dideoxygalactose transaminase
MRVSEITGALANVQLGKLDMIMNCYRERKEIFLHELEEIMIPRGHDQNGECHHALHFSLDNPKLAAFISKKMMAYSFECLPVSMRPAHAVWKWGDFLGTRASYSEKTNPLKNVSTKKYHKINFLSSYQILNSTLKLDIDPTLSLEQTRLMAIKIKGILKEFIYRYNNLQHRV